MQATNEILVMAVDLEGAVPRLVETKRAELASDFASERGLSGRDCDYRIVLLSRVSHVESAQCSFPVVGHHDSPLVTADSGSARGGLVASVDGVHDWRLRTYMAYIKSVENSPNAIVG